AAVFLGSEAPLLGDDGALARRIVQLLGSGEGSPGCSSGRRRSAQGLSCNDGGMFSSNRAPYMRGTMRTLVFMGHLPRLKLAAHTGLRRRRSVQRLEGFWWGRQTATTKRIGILEKK
ncbi:hypothetical protein HN873_016543, partial [Arachis hypogaea]